MKYNFLTGIKVVELGRIITAPYASKLFQDLGAEVIKIEAGNGDPYRELPPKIGNVSLWFANFNAGKKVIKIPDWKLWKSNDDVVESLKSANILIENFKPGTLKKYGLDFDSLKKLNNKIIYVSISAFGQNGSLATKPGFDIIVQAISGYLLDYETGNVIHPHTYLSDYAAGLFAAFASLAVLFSKPKKAVHVDVSMFDILISWSLIFNLIVHYDKSFKDIIFKMDPVAFPYGNFITKDGKNVVIAVVGSSMVKRFYESFKEEMQNSKISFEDFFNPSKFIILKEKVSNIIRNKNFEDLKGILDKAGIPYEEVKSGLNLMNETFVLEKNLFEDMDVENNRVKVIRFPVNIKQEEE